MVISKKYKIFASLVLTAVIITGALVIYSYINKNDNSNVQQIISKVGEHYLLPADEQPTIATVEDKTKLTSGFFRAAQNGDKLLVYSDAKKVILYRPGIEKIIEVGPISIAEINGDE